METWDAVRARRRRPLVYLIPFGYPAGRPLRPVAHPNRRPFAEVVHRGIW